MGNSLMRDEEGYVMQCRCGKLATYRCEYEGRLVTYNDIPGHPLLKQYWHSSCGDDTQFIACDNCIREETIGYFTHLPNGWSEQPKYHINYEPINLDWVKTKLQ